MFEKICGVIIAATLIGGTVSSGAAILESIRDLPLRAPAIVEAVELALSDPAFGSDPTLKNQMQSDLHSLYELLPVGILN